MFNYFDDTITTYMDDKMYFNGWNTISFATLLQLSFNSTKQLIFDFASIHMTYVNIYVKLW
jgi:hypothetical protein